MNLIQDIAFRGLPYPAPQMEGSVVQKRQNGSDAEGACQAADSVSQPATAAYDPISARRRKAQTERRLRWLEARWDDDAYFRTAAETGRYLKLCMLIEWASAMDAEAGARLAAEATPADA